MVSAEQRLGKNISAATNAHVTTEEPLTRRFYSVLAEAI
jgi:hypothetical protein